MILESACTFAALATTQLNKYNSFNPPMLSKLRYLLQTQPDLTSSYSRLPALARLGHHTLCSHFPRAGMLSSLVS